MTADGARSVQMNVRMDAALKQRGDEELRRLGVTPSELVRRVWAYVAQTGELPDLQVPDGRPLDVAARVESLRESWGIR